MREDDGHLLPADIRPLHASFEVGHGLLQRLRHTLIHEDWPIRAKVMQGRRELHRLAVVPGHITPM
jgi:hypothetical protein